MLAPAFQRNLVVGASEQVVVAACLNHKSRFVVRIIHEAFADVELARLPGSQALRNLFGKLCGVGGGMKGDRREIAGELMMSVAVSRCASEARDNHQRAKGTNNSHHVAKHNLLVPLRCRFHPRFREAVIESAGKELIASIKPTRLQQLLGANYAERLEEQGADDILSTFTAIEREVSHARLIATSETRNQRGVFIVRMRARVHRARGSL